MTKIKNSTGAVANQPPPIGKPKKNTRAEQSRINGSQSHGPASPAGQIASSRSALKHGLTASILKTYRALDATRKGTKNTPEPEYPPPYQKPAFDNNADPQSAPSLPSPQPCAPLKPNEPEPDPDPLEKTQPSDLSGPPQIPE